MTSISIRDLVGSVRGRGNPITGIATSDFIREQSVPPIPPNFTKAHLEQFEKEGWLKKTFMYRHDCMVNLASVTEQLRDGKMLSNKALLEARKQYLLDEINVCHRMLSMFTQEMN